MKTRETLLQHAYQQIHEYGFQAVSLEAILQDTGVTKGALYHHFPNKNALGYAVIEEIIAPNLAEFWIKPVIESNDPIHALQAVIRSEGESMTMAELKMGCPLNNLSQEMSSVDEGFRNRMDAIYSEWRRHYSEALAAGIKSGKVKKRLDIEATAVFLIASLEGCIGMAKNAQSMDVLNQCGMGILSYLDSLLPEVEKTDK